MPPSPSVSHPRVRSSNIPKAIIQAKNAEIAKQKEDGKKPAADVGGATPGWNTKPGQGKVANTHDNSR